MQRDDASRESMARPHSSTVSGATNEGSGVWKVAFDDGAGRTKIVSVDPVTGEVRRANITAIAGHSSWMDMGLADQARPPIQVEEPFVAAGGFVFPEQNVMYGVGERMLAQDDAVFDVSNGRYTDPMARVRLHAALSRVVPDTNARIDLRVGLNGDRYTNKDARSAVQAYFAGQHVFRADRREYRIEVVKSRVESQPWAAAKYIRRNPPAEFAERLVRMPLDTSNMVVIDGGRFTTDVAALYPDPNGSGKLLPFKVFALTEAVAMMTRRVSEAMFALTHTRPPLREVESLFDSRSPSYGKLRLGNDIIDMTVSIARIKQDVWSAAWTNLRNEVGEFRMHYIIVVGGLPYVAGTEIRQTPLANGKPLSAFAGFHIPTDPEWIVALGMLED